MRTSIRTESRYSHDTARLIAQPGNAALRPDVQVLSAYAPCGPIIAQVAAHPGAAQKLHSNMGIYTMPTKTPVKPNPESSMARRSREVQILAKSIYRDMTAQGFNTSDIVNLATALLDQVTTKMSSSNPTPPD